MRRGSQRRIVRIAGLVVAATLASLNIAGAQRDAPPVAAGSPAGRQVEPAVPDAAQASSSTPEQVFSGPQVGERIAPFSIRLALGEQSGEVYDPASSAQGKPLLLVFVHEVTRPSVALMRTVTDYGHSLANQGLQSAVILLSPDPAEAEAFVRRAQHALPSSVPLGISLDGLEGPGAYGLNRNVMLTVLVCKDDRVTDNFALVQPSLQVDGPKIGRAIQKVLGHDHEPTLEEMGVERARSGAMGDERFRELMRGVIDRQASDEMVRAAAERVEQAAADNEALRRRIGDAARRIVEAGKLEDYGTPTAQEWLKKWADKFGSTDAALPHSTTGSEDSADPK
jgi:hypothetical protein